MAEVTGQVTSTKELYWLGCREKTCCHNTKVIITGKDMWRIRHAMEIQPWDFTLYAEAPEGAVDGFQLEAGGPAYQVMLSKRRQVDQAGAPCIFLWKLADGHAQCGLGQLRPMVCQSYPALLVDNMLYVESSACTCRRWSVTDLDHDAEIDRLNRVLEEAAEYSEIVARWNDELERLAGVRTYRQFCEFVLQYYASRYGDEDG